MGYISGILALITALLISANVYLVKKSTRLEAKLQNTEAYIDLQNQAIEALALDTQAYTCDLDTMETYTRAKYDKVLSDGESCEAKLEALKQVLDLFNHSKAH